MTERSGFHSENPQVAEVLYRFPTLTYLLGNVAQETVTDKRDESSKTKYILQEGSGMFGLTNPEDAMEWKGIFNHVIGSVRNVYFISQKLQSLTEEQRQKFADLGYDHNSLTTLDPDSLRDFMFISHAGRRMADEHTWYAIHLPPQKDPQNQRPQDHSYLYTMEILESMDASQQLKDLMRVEDHVHEVEGAKEGRIKNVVDNILTYCDWTYGQTPTPLDVRFQGLRASGRQSNEILDILETVGTNFENALKKVLGENIYDQMANTDPFPGEVEIRTAYAASAGLTLAQIYPDFAAKYAA